MKKLDALIGTAGMALPWSIGVDELWKIAVSIGSPVVVLCVTHGVAFARRVLILKLEQDLSWKAAIVAVLREDAQIKALKGKDASKTD